MTAEKVTIDYHLLVGVRASIKQIVAELEDAPERSGDISGAIGQPFDLAQLSDLASDFRGSWEPKRDDLISTLEDISTYIDDVVGTFGELDWGY